MSRQPNFVLFVTDQHRADHLGCYGHPVLRTPNIDALAARGATFERFFVTSPVCMPNRASLMTGRMPSIHGVRSNGIPLSMRQTTFVELLAAAGYDTALIGKSHLQNFTGNPPLVRAPESRDGLRAPPEGLREAFKDPWDDGDYDQESPWFWQENNAGVRTPFYGFDHVELCTGHGDEVGGDYRRWLLERRPDGLSLIGPENALPGDGGCPQAWRTAVPEDLYPTTYIAERAEAWLKTRSSQDRPFFLMVSFPDPHHPFTPPGRYWDLYRPEDMETPVGFRGEQWEPPPHVRWIHEQRTRGQANLQKSMMALGVDEAEARAARALSCGMIAMVDDAVGRVCSALAASGRKEDTVVAFTSDHGDYLGDHRLLLKGPIHYQGLIRTPFVWADPASSGVASRPATLAGTMDIAPTILERAGLLGPVGLQGRSLLPAMADPSHRIWDRWVVEEDQQRSTFGFDGPIRVRTLLQDRWRMSLYDGVAWGELYDLENDPGELANLWDDAAAAGARSAMMEGLARAGLSLVDRAPLPTGLA